MNKYSLPILTAAVAMIFMLGGQLDAQSTVVEIDGGPSSTQSVAVKGPLQQSFPPSTANTRQRNWESILARSFPSEFQGEQTCAQLIRGLRKIGLPVVLDVSARDDSLTGDEPISLDLPNEPLYIRLQNSLIEKNAVLSIVGDTLTIISLDVAYSPEYFLRQSYDVTALNVDGQSLSNQIMAAITPEDWGDSGGYSTASALDVNGTRVLTINAPYTTHREIRAMLKELFDLQYSLARGSTGRAARNSLTSSRAIEIPIAKAIRTKRGKFNGGGIGGFGLGGGVF